MLASLIENQDVVERCLGRLRLFKKMISNEEWDIIRSLAKFLNVFKEATAILSGCKYATVSLVLLFRSEMLQTLQDSPGDCSVVQMLKHHMRAALERRLPITELYVVAAMLDPAQRHLQVVQDFLTDHDITAVQLLSKYLDLYTLDENEEPTQESAQAGIDNDTVPWKKQRWIC
jgi:hypothetical protein